MLSAPLILLLLFKNVVFRLVPYATATMATIVFSLGLYVVAWSSVASQVLVALVANVIQPNLM